MSPRNVIQSYKKVLNQALISRGSASDLDFNLTSGVDSIAAGQTGVIDADVPTGSVVKYIEILLAFTNLVAVSNILNFGIQLVHSGQTPVSMLTVGGNPQRNQVFRQYLKSIGKEQNSNFTIKFKVPPKFQRIREGDRWVFSRNGSAVFAEAFEVHYKFYR